MKKVIIIIIIFALCSFQEKPKIVLADTTNRKVKIMYYESDIIHSDPNIWCEDKCSRLYVKTDTSINIYILIGRNKKQK